MIIDADLQLLLPVLSAVVVYNSNGGVLLSFLQTKKIFFLRHHYRAKT